MEKNKVWLDSQFIYVENELGEVGKKPISRYAALLTATEQQRENFELSSCGIHWYELDVDLAFDSFFHPEKYNLSATQETYADAL